METVIETNVSDQVAAIAEKWRGRDGNLIMILHEIQGHFGYIPREVALDLSNWPSTSRLLAFMR